MNLLRSFSKAADESTSLLGQLLVQRERPGGRCQFDAGDADCRVYKAARRSYRIFEEKLPGEEVSDSQKRRLPIDAAMISHAVATGRLKDGGVYLVRFPCSTVAAMDDPLTQIAVAEVLPLWYEFKLSSKFSATWAELRSLFIGESFDSIERLSIESDIADLEWRRAAGVTIDPVVIADLHRRLDALRLEVSA